MSLSLGALGVKKMAEHEKTANLMRFGLSFVLSDSAIDSFFNSLTADDAFSEKLEQVKEEKKSKKYKAVNLICCSLNLAFIIVRELNPHYLGTKYCEIHLNSVQKIR